MICGRTKNPECNVDLEFVEQQPIEEPSRGKINVPRTFSHMAYCRGCGRDYGIREKDGKLFMKDSAKDYVPV